MSQGLAFTLGGDPAATLERVTQDRSRLVRALGALGALGVAGARELFETRNERRQWVTRMAIDPKRIELVLGGDPTADVKQGLAPTSRRR